jgi:hypothetical protein
MSVGGVTGVPGAAGSPGVAGVGLLLSSSPVTSSPVANVFTLVGVKPDALRASTKAVYLSLFPKRLKTPRGGLTDISVEFKG